jgi:hypothetical protein
MRIVEIMGAHAPVGLTADEVTLTMNHYGRDISPNQVATRMGELRNERRIMYHMVDEGPDGRPVWETRKTSRGHNANVQYLVEVKR